jgi:hypothetical protein
MDLTLSSSVLNTRHCQVNPLRKETPMNTVTHTDAFDNSFPYVLVSSLLGALVSLAAVWISAAATFGPMVGA